jgi:hypothetical protein
MSNKLLRIYTWRVQYAPAAVPAQRRLLVRLEGDVLTPAATTIGHPLAFVRTLQRYRRP